MSCVNLFLEQARQHGARTALLEGSRVVTYAELATFARRCASRLARAGVERGTRVIVLIPMSVELYGWLIGLLLLDATVVFVEPWMPLHLLSDCLRKAHPAGLLASPPLGVLLTQRSRPFRALPCRWTTRGAWLLRPLGWQAVPEARACVGAAPRAAPDDVAVLTFTTGSSGVPKGVVRTHGLLATQHEILSRALGLVSGDVCLHVFANFILNNLALGASSVIPPIRAAEPTKFSARRLVRHIDRARVTSIVCPPASLQRLVDHCEPRRMRLPSVRSLATGGGPVSNRLLERAAAIFPHADPAVVYGSSEAEPVSHVHWSELKTLSGTGACVGAPVSGISVRLSDAGEVMVSGPHVSRSYFEDPAAMAATKLVDPDGTLWHRMGDLARLDVDGRLWLTGRLHSLIHTARGPVLPLPLECTAESRDFVAAAAALGLGPAGSARAILAVEPRRWDEDRMPEWRRELLAALPELDDVRFVRAIPRDRRHRSKIDHARLRTLLGEEAIA